MAAPSAPPEAPVETTPVDPEPQETQTEEPTTTEVVVEPAADAPEDAATQVVVTEEPKPNYLTVEQWEKDKAEVAARAAADALETDRRRRQTEGARRALAEKREAEAIVEERDVVRATLASRLGLDPQQMPDDVIDTAINRAARRRAEGLVAGETEKVDQAFEYITAKAYQKDVDWDDEIGAFGGGRV